MSIGYEMSGPFVLRVTDRPAGFDYVEIADGSKSTMNLSLAHAQRFASREEAEAAKRNIPPPLDVVPEGEALKAVGESRAISVAGGSPDESLTVPTQIAGRRVTQREAVSGEPA